MKQQFKTLCWLNAIILILLAYQFIDLIALLDDKKLYRDAVKKDELHVRPRTNATRIPRIIHQTYKIKDIPSVWIEAQRSIKALHPDYEYILWTDEMARLFIAEHYDWFLPTFDRYKYPIMRADAIRYFILYHYGGIYIDLDNGLREPLDPLLNFSAWLRKTRPTGVSNDIMGSSPGHPFFKKVIESLRKHNRNLIIPYITVMYSTGPLFLSVILEKYKRSIFGLGDSADRSTNDWVRILSTNKKSSKDGCLLALATEFFFTVQGSSWHKGDAQYISFMRENWIYFLVLFSFIGLSALIILFILEIKMLQLTAYILKVPVQYFRKSSDSDSSTSLALCRYISRLRLSNLQESDMEKGYHRQ